jgi:hypothetical protein
VRLRVRVCVRVVTPIVPNEVEALAFDRGLHSRMDLTEAQEDLLQV